MKILKELLVKFSFGYSIWLFKRYYCIILSTHNKAKNIAKKENYFPLFVENRKEEARVARYTFQGASFCVTPTSSVGGRCVEKWFIFPRNAPRYDEETEYFSNQKTLLLKILLNRTPNSKIIREHHQVFPLWSSHGRQAIEEKVLFSSTTWN